MQPHIAKELRLNYLLNSSILFIHLFFLQIPIEHAKLFLSCLIYWLNSFHPSNSLVDDFKKLLTKYPNTDVAAMGFPNNWETEPLWQ